MMTSNFKARPTIYKRVQMRSRLEAGLAAWLDKHHFTWEYEPCAFATEKGQYLPDFRLTGAYVSWLPEPATVYVEVKPASFYALADGSQAYKDMDRLSRQAAILARSEPDAVMVLMQPRPSPYLAYAMVKRDNADYVPYPLQLIWLPEDYVGGRIGFGKHVMQDPWHGDYWTAQP